MLLSALGDGFSDSGNNVHTRNPAKEALRRIALIDIRRPRLRNGLNSYSNTGASSPMIPSDEIFEDESYFNREYDPDKAEARNG